MPLWSFRNIEYFRTFSQTAQVWVESFLPPLQTSTTWHERKTPGEALRIFGPKNMELSVAILIKRQKGGDVGEEDVIWVMVGVYLARDLGSWEDDFCVQRTCSWGHRHFPHRCCQVADSSQHEEGTSGDVIQNSALVEQEDDHFGGSWDETPLLQPYFWWTIQEILQIGQIVCILNLEQYDMLTTCSKHIWAISFCVRKAQPIHDSFWPSKSLKNTTQVGRKTWNLLI